MKRRDDGTIDPAWVAEEAAMRLQDAPAREARQVGELMVTAIKLIEDGLDLGQLKLLNRAMKEMRYSYKIFNDYPGVRKVSIFGSARTPEDHPDYLSAHMFGRRLAEKGWMAITGAGDGIMKAGHEGPSRESSFGLRIRLPFETNANDVIEGDPKLINFKYFFTRKLMFVSNSDAIAVYPGGFGTQDELFESLTLIQTGKSEIMPVVLLQGKDVDYWQRWERGITDNLLERGWISPEDPGLYFIAPDEDSAIKHILHFYRRFQSSRYVHDRFVMRLKAPLAPEQVKEIAHEFDTIIKPGTLEQSGPLKGEKTELELTRLHFEHRRYSFGTLRRLINRVNDFPMEGDE